MRCRWGDRLRDDVCVADGVIVCGIDEGGGWGRLSDDGRPCLRDKLRAMDHGRGMMKAAGGGMDFGCWRLPGVLHQPGMIASFE